MEENPPRVSRRDEAYGGSRAGSKWKSKYTVDDTGDLIDCSGKSCRSCTAGMIADCVALCCCPCAVLNLLTLAFVKVPWTVGRRCLRLGKKKRKRLEKKKKCKENEGYQFMVEGDWSLRKGKVEDGFREIACGFGEGDEMGSFSARFEAERVWLELHQLDHLGFGRVSFSSSS